MHKHMGTHSNLVNQSTFQLFTPALDQAVACLVLRHLDQLRLVH